MLQKFKVLVFHSFDDEVAEEFEFYAESAEQAKSEAERDYFPGVVAMVYQ
jgi:hypothetical protein